MSAVTSSPLSPAPPSPTLTAATPAPDRRGASSADAALRSNQKPPPVHTGADWQVLLHLPQMEAWLRASGARVTQLTHSAAQDGAGRHVDAHLLQLKDICEDISDHVEQIHALLETEFSLKLLSYSVNIIVDIRTVQLLWHQLRVSVLVLKERLLQGLQDPNGNFTRQTDILQAFSRDRDRRHQTRRLDALTEVDDCGQLTIRCSQDYFSLDCGITAFELSDYSPGDEPQTRENRSLGEDASQEPEKVQEADSEKIDVQNASPKLVIPDGSLSHPHPVSGESKSTNHSEAAKRSLPGDDRNTEPSLPKRVALISYEVEDAGGVSETKLGDSTAADLADPLMDPLTDLPDRSKFWLELDSVLSGKDIHKVIDSHDVQRGHTMTNGSSLEPSPPPRVVASQRDRADIWPHSDGDSDSSAPSPVRDQVLSSDLEASGEESDPRPPPCKIPSWLVKQKERKQDFQASSEASADRVHWYGSEEFLALPAQIHKSEILAINLDSLAHAMRAGGEDVSHDALQDVDDWDLTELKQDNWDSPESGDDIPSPPFGPIRRNLLGRVSPASSSDIAPSLDDESVESGQLSELLSEEEGRLLGPAAPPADGRGSASPVRRLLDDIGQDGDPDVWNKMAEFVQQLDGFIGWMQGALESTRAWTPPPTARLDALHDFLDTHLTFKLNVDSRGALKESIMEDGTALLAIIPAHQSGLRDILEMVSGQWEQLQLQIRRQHAWMLRALRLVRTRLLPHAGQSRLPDRPQAELPSGRHDAQRAHKLKSLQYASAANRDRYAHSNSLQDFERAYEELWDRLTDADAAAATSDERRRRLLEVPGNFLEADLADLQRPNPDRAPPTASPPDDSWEWDETDMTAGEAPEVPEPDLTHDLPCRDSSLRPRSAPRALPAVYQAYGLHAVEFHTAPELPRASSEATARKRQVFRKCLSKDSTFSSMESLPDLLGGLTPGERGAARRSESESGIASDAGDAEMILCRGILANEDAATAMPLKEDQRGPGVQRASGTTEEVDELFSLRKGGSQDLEIPEKDQEQSDQSAPKFLLRHGLNKLPSSPVLSPGSSLESLLSLGLDLFPSKDHLHRSASLESGLLELDLCRTRDEDRDGPQDQKCGGGQGELSSGELSRRTLDLLKRLENIQTPAAAKMTRSVSDMTLRSRSSLGRRPAAWSSPGGRRRRGSHEALPSLVRESSPSLAELSGAEESSVGSEDLPVLPERGNPLPDRASARGGERTSSARSCERSGRREEADAVSLSMVVNVSCASACTDDEDDGDLLSSSTLTLTEEEMGVQEEEEEERLTDSSSGNEDEAAVEEPYVLGSDYMKTELQAWIRPPRASSETEVGLCDELRCGTKPEQEHLLNSTELDQQLQRKEENGRDVARSFISQFADDVENGNVERSGSKGKDEDDRLLREESGVFTKRGEALDKKGEPHTSRGELLRESFTFSKVKEDINSPNGFPSSPSCEFLPPAGASSLVGQLKGELPCQSASPTTKEGRRSCDRKAITIQEKLKFSSLVTEQSRSQLRDKHSCLPTKKWKSSDGGSCRRHLVPSPPTARTEQAVRDFVMEILDLTSEARRSKEALGREPTPDAEISPASFKHIRHKVAQHSHRPLHLSRGDFYAYLSLSSHDSDCGEVAQHADDESAAPVAAAHADRRDDNDVCTLDFKSPDRPVPSPPPSPDVRDEETLFPACTEEVYPGPPLCYNVPPGKKTPKIFQANALQPFPNEEARLADPEEVRSVVSATPEPPYGSSAVDFPPAQETPEISEAEGPQTSQGSCLEGKTLEEVRSVVSAVPEFPSGSFSAAGEASGEARRGGASLLGGCDVSGQREEAPSNEAPSYLNPRARVAPIDSSPAQCSADTKTLQSNIGAVMTKISVGGSATNPSKEPPASATRINPKINYRPIKEADRAAAAAAAGRRGAADARGAKRPEDRTAGRRRWELKSTAPTAAVKKKQVSAVNRDAKAAQGRSQVSVRPIRTGPARAATLMCDC
ncbi:A-kinase anchor protein 6 isoform X6 [Phyllopteryx taeniolatus]|uniref:A-kinase anchor protein 6 isoform X6 n=1 Tax=Phyllopteryx taeniolatus TaxID=161469 RepID=UPI002AD27E10|nr:A-kinase anchor protein 6 isoform X6 [Phyllopteryx taeniolatus]